MRTQGTTPKSTQVHTKYFCTARAAAQGYRPDAALRETHESRIENACRTGEPYLGAIWAFAREDCARCASGLDPSSILLCDGANCSVEMHYYCAGLDAVPPGHWFCSDKCRDSVPGAVVAGGRRVGGGRRNEGRAPEPDRAMGDAESRRGVVAAVRHAEARRARAYGISLSAVSHLFNKGTRDWQSLAA